MLACFRIGAVVLPCNEQLRAKDLRLRLEAARPALIVADERNLAELEPRRSPTAACSPIPDASLFDAEPAPPAELDPGDPCLITFTSGTTGEPNGIVHGQRYLPGQHLQSEHWLGAQPGDLVWCTAASGWSKSARNAFIAPWIRGAAALLHDARFDPQERLEILARRERQRALHGPDRVPRDRQASRDQAGAEPARTRRRRRGAQPRGAEARSRRRPGSRSATATARPRPASSPACRSGSRCGRVRWAARSPASNLIVDDGELVLQDPTTDPDLLRRLPRSPGPRRPPSETVAHGRPGASGRGRLPVLRRTRRRRDHLRRLPDRSVRGRVGARLT